MQNTIGYTYKLLCEENTQQKEIDIQKANKWYHKLWKNIVRYCIKGEGTTTTKDTENSIEDWKRQAETYLKKSVEIIPRDVITRIWEHTMRQLGIMTRH